MFAPWKKCYDQLTQHIKKQRYYFSNKGLVVKAMVFPVVSYGCETWARKKAEHWRTDAFELWCWRRFLRVPWTARSNLAILKEINPEYSLEGLMLKLKQYFGHLMWRLTHWKRPWCWERLKIGDGNDRMRWLDSITDLIDVSLSKSREMMMDRKAWWVGDGQGNLVCFSAWGSKESDVTEWLNWTELNLQGSYPHRDQTQVSPSLQMDSLPSEAPEKPVYPYTLMYFMPSSLHLLIPYPYLAPSLHPCTTRNH